MKGRRFAVALVVGLVGGLAAVVAPATAQGPTRQVQVIADQPGHQIRWLALGDSYSSGEGVDPNYGRCARSPDAYAEVARDRLAAEGYRIAEQDFLACSGAQIQDVTGSVDLVEQIDQATGRYDLITLSIGGNDSGFGPMVERCLEIGLARYTKLAVPWGRLLDLMPCADEDAKRREIDAVGSALVEIYGRLIDELLAPGGHIVVLGYPRLFEPSYRWVLTGYPRTTCELFSALDADMVRRLSDRLNERIRDAASEYEEVSYLDVAEAFEGHNLCAGWRTTNEWINGISTGRGSNRGFRYQHSFHPNAAGHSAEGTLLADLIEDLDWPSVRLRYDGLSVTLRHGGLIGDDDTVDANFGSHPPPGDMDIVAAISAVLGEPRYSRPVEALFVPGQMPPCADDIDRVVVWMGPAGGGSLVGGNLAVTLRDEEGHTELVGYRSYAGLPAIEMADGVPFWADLGLLYLRYLFTSTRVSILDRTLNSGARAFVLRGPSPAGPAYGVVLPAGDVESGEGIIIRGSGDRCGLGPSF